MVAGQAVVSAPNATTTLITQSSQKAIINWQSFSVASGGLVQFAQPGASAITLNRVTGSTPSAIDGAIRANGQVWLINPNGVLFGQGAQINVAGLLATTSDIADGDFLSGNYNFSGSSNATVVNNGAIHARKGGSVTLSGASVTNSGLISARAGHVVLGGADAFTVDFTGDHLISYQVTQSVARQTTDANGNPQSATVTNSGVIRAAGGQVLMTARAAANIADGVVNNTGMVSATSARQENGEIILDAGDGDATSSGTLDASGKAPGQTGGSVQVLGQTVALADGAKIDVSGDAGGGTALIGGNFHGAGPQQNAQTTTIGNANIDADAIHTGNGGKVAVWSNSSTQVAGTISARGGAQSGNGGYVETSGHSLGIAPSASVDASATHGAPGTWLLDPVNITISDTDPSPGNDTQGTLTNGNLAVGTDPGQNDYITPATIQSTLFGDGSSTGTSVSLNASSDIFVQSPITAQTYSGASVPTFTLFAGDSIQVNAQMSMANYPVFLTATNAVLQGSPILGSGGLTVTSTASNITLITTTNAETGTVTFSAPGTIAFNNSATTVLGTVNGGISGNTVLSATSLTVDPQSGSGITVGGAVNVSGAVSLTTPGNIAQSAPIVAGSLTATSTGGSIALTNANNQISGAALFNSATDTSFTNSVSTTLGIPGNDNPQTSVIGGNLDVEVNNNNQSSGNSSLTMNGRVHTQQTTATGDTVLHATGDIINNAGNGTITATNLSLVSDNGNIGPGSWTFGLGTDSGGSLNLHASAPNGNITINPGSLNIGTDLGGPGLQAQNILIFGNGVVTQNADATGTIVANSLDVHAATSATLTNPNNAVSTVSFTTPGAATFYNSIATTLNRASNGSNTQPMGDLDVEVADPSNATSPALNLTGNSSSDSIDSSGTVILHAAGAITTTGNPLIASTVKLTSDTAGIGTTGTVINLNAGTVTAVSGNNQGIFLGDIPSGGAVTIGDGTNGINAGTGNVVLLFDSAQVTSTSTSAGVITANNLRLSSASASLYDVEVSTLNASANSGALNISTNTSFQLNNVTGAAGAAAINDPGGSVVLVAKGAAGSITQGSGPSGSIAAGNFEADATAVGGQVTLSDINNAITGTIVLTSLGNTNLYDFSPAVLGTSAAGGTLQIQSAAGITINSGATLTSAASGTAIVLAAGTNFTNNAGSNALAMTRGGHFLIYSVNPTSDTFGGLNSNNTAIWNTSFPATGGATGNRYIFSFSPAVTFTAGNVSKIYGNDASNLVANDLSISGVQAGVSGAFLGDTSATAYSGVPTISATGGTGAGAAVGSYAIMPGGNLTALNGYHLVLQNGTLTVNPATLTYNANSATTVAGSTIPSLSGAVTGFVNGDTQSSATTGTLAFSTNATSASAAGSYYIVGSGLSASNYVFDQALANLTAFVVTAVPGTSSQTTVTTPTVTPIVTPTTPSTTVIPVVVNNTPTPTVTTAPTITIQPLLSFIAAQPLLQLNTFVSDLGLPPGNQTAPAITPSTLVVTTGTPAPASTPIQTMTESSGNGGGSAGPPSSSDVATTYVVYSLNGGAQPPRTSPGSTPIVIPGLLHRISGRPPGGEGASVNDSDLSAWGNAALWQ